MVIKNPVSGVGLYRGYRRDQERFGQELLMQLILSTTEADELVADQSALQLAQHQLDQGALAATALRRRAIPPRRHLRNK